MLIEPFVLFALGAALSFTCADFFARKGLQYAKPFRGRHHHAGGRVGSLNSVGLPFMFSLPGNGPALSVGDDWRPVQPRAFPHLFSDRHSPDRCGARGTDKGDVPHIRRPFGGHFSGRGAGLVPSNGRCVRGGRHRVARIGKNGRAMEPLGRPLARVRSDDIGVWSYVLEKKAWSLSKAHLPLR